MSTEFSKQETLGNPEAPGGAPADIFCTVLFAMGLFLTILFIFFNILDLSRVSWYRANKDSAQLEVQQLEREFYQRPKATHAQPIGKPGGNTEDAKKERDRKQKILDEAREEYNEARPKLERAITEAQLRLSFNQYWYYWGLFIGVVVLSMGSLGFLIVRGPTTRRIIGGVVLCLIVGWFVTFLITKSVYASFSVGRPFF